jgi:hypothetical protein
MSAEKAPTIGVVHETRTREHQGSSTGVGRAQRDEQALDDWLGDVSDEDWDDSAARPSVGQRGGSTRATAPPAADDAARPDETPSRGRSGGGVDRHRATIERRRYTAGLVLLVLVGVAVAVPVLLLRGGGNDATPAGATTGTTSATTPSATTPTTTAPTTTTPTTPTDTTATTPSGTSGSSTFTLPEGTKLRVGQDNDPETVRRLQQALTTAGYDPGAADGTYGPQTKAAVVAFQEANGLSADGVVGPDTAAALNSALATG